jgi:hypothetical protein
VSVGHILHNGEIESHIATERRLVKTAGGSGDLFVTGQDERLAAAYRRRARRRVPPQGREQDAGEDGEQEDDNRQQEESR